jgi:hypothetical protein
MMPEQRRRGFIWMVCRLFQELQLRRKFISWPSWQKTDVIILDARNGGILQKPAIITIIAAAAVLLPRSGYYLTLRNRDTGEVYARYKMGEGDRFSVTFIHSVNKYPLTDTYEIENKTIYVEETTYCSFGAGVQTELNPGETLDKVYVDRPDYKGWAMVIRNIHQDRTNVGYIVGTVSDHVLNVNGEDVSLRDLCGKNAPVRFNYEFWLV